MKVPFLNKVKIIFIIFYKDQILKDITKGKTVKILNK